MGVGVDQAGRDPPAFALDDVGRVQIGRLAGRPGIEGAAGAGGDYAILDDAFSQATGELTPTLKLKRKVVVERYADTIDALYGS